MPAEEHLIGQLTDSHHEGNDIALPASTDNHAERRVCSEILFAEPDTDFVLKLLIFVRFDQDWLYHEFTSIFMGALAPPQNTSPEDTTKA